MKAVTVKEIGQELLNLTPKELREDLDPKNNPSGLTNDRLYPYL